MTTYIAFLRGINVGGNRKIPMADLRAFATKLGLENVQTLLQSGNLVFTSPSRSSAALEKTLEAAAAKHFKIGIDFMVRSAKELNEIIARNPMPDQAKNDPSHLLIMFLKAPAKAAGVEAIRATITGPEIVHADGAHLYIDYRDGIGTSKLTGAIIERKLATKATGRNWNTLTKLAALAAS